MHLSLRDRVLKASIKQGSTMRKKPIDRRRLGVKKETVRQLQLEQRTLDNGQLAQVAGGVIVGNKASCPCATFC